jgi:hypothetical protein
LIVAVAASGFVQRALFGGLVRLLRARSERGAIQIIDPHVS